MDSRPARTLLARLRVSTRLAVLVLLVFALKLGAAAACAQHDYADLGLGKGDPHAAVVKAVDSQAGNDLSKAQPGYAGACSHCSCHHASALPTGTVLAFVWISREVVIHRSGAPPSAAGRLELRPPIA